MTKLTDRVKMYTDGACRGNPGPGGWGVIIIDEHKSKEYSGFDETTTNNRMEMMASIEGLKIIPTDCKVTLYTDSMYLKNGINDWMPKWKANGWKTSARKPVKNKDLWVELDELVSYREVIWSWVRGHSGNPGNE
mgnify:CR=1 FL=1